ncbi:MAG TPA: hypothetical protein VGK48_08635 [Terriglobia bacterium]|jgi:uncharacterized protein with PQ loop repeat
MESAVATLAEWKTFYGIVGTAAASLTGLQFVVIALVAQVRTRSSGHEIAAFGSPNVVHFCAALFLSAALSAPWHSFRTARLPLIACGFIGVVYAVVVAWRARRQTGYKPVFEDWLWHVALPMLAYAALLVAGALLSRFTLSSLFAIAATALLLVYIGIHNAWDTVVYLAITYLRREDN